MKPAPISLALLLICAAAVAGDWPMWRYDAARSAASPDEIATNLTLLWSRQLPPVRPAWPHDPERRLNFDASYEPVVMGKRLFLGSPNDGSVTAYDTETGAELWKFFTEGPIRCAPACWNGKVYAGSDDGHLYCLDAQSGTVVWKFRGAPADRPDRRQIGNGHLVSLWPVRGGPVVVNSVVYFGAGVWSIFGVFVHALDAETGKAKWTNGDLHYVRTRVPCLDQIGESGVSPQGYLAAIRDRLVVPNGRAMPAGLALATGKLIYYLQGGRGGDSRVVAHGEYAFVGRDRIVNLYDFREVASKWAYQGNQAPTGYVNVVGWQDYRESLAETLYLPYKTIDGCDASSAFADGVAYGVARGVFYAYDVSKARTVDAEWPYYGKMVTSWKWEPPAVWQFKTSHTNLDGNLVIKAGPRLYGAAGKKLLVTEDLKGEPRIVWEMDLDGKPTSIIAADNKLFVATAEGGLCCFGRPPCPVGLELAESRLRPDDRSGPAKTYAYKPAALQPTNDAATAKVQEIVKATGVKAGYCLVLGLSDGRLIEELLRQTELLVIGVDADAKKLNALRQRWAATGHYGSRVELFTGEPFEFLFPPYLASLIVSEDAWVAGFPEKMDVGKLFQILRPYGGTLCLDLPAGQRPHFEAWAKGAGAPNAAVKSGGDYSLLVREGALPGSAPWTHEAADAARTLCSQDDLVKAPLGVLWYGDVPGFFLPKAMLRPEVNQGRIYALDVGARSVTITAYDAYTGRFLWSNRLSEPSTAGHGRFVALADALYVALDGGLCKVCDPATGKLLKTFTFDATVASAAKDVRVDGDALLIACGKVNEKELNADYWAQGANESSTLVCLDRQTGAELWRREAQHRFNNSAVVMGTGMVFCVDSIPPAPYGKWKQRVEGLKTCESVLLALDARTGRAVWSVTNTYECTKGGADEWLAYSAETGSLLGGRLSLAHAWEARTGNPLWANKPVLCGPMIIRGRAFIGCEFQQAGTRWAEKEYDLSTGELTGRPSLLSGMGCNYPLGGRHLLTERVSNFAYIDLDAGKLYSLRNIRPGCMNGAIAADGLLNAPSMGLGCVCSYPLLTSFALCTMPEVAAWSGGAPVIATPPPAKAPTAPAPKTE